MCAYLCRPSSSSVSSSSISSSYVSGSNGRVSTDKKFGSFTKWSSLPKSDTMRGTIQTIKTFSSQTTLKLAYQIEISLHSTSICRSGIGSGSRSGSVSLRGSSSSLRSLAEPLRTSSFSSSLPRLTSSTELAGLFAPFLRSSSSELMSSASP